LLSVVAIGCEVNPEWLLLLLLLLLINTTPEHHAHYERAVWSLPQRKLEKNPSSSNSRVARIAEQQNSVSHTLHAAARTQQHRNPQERRRSTRTDTKYLYSRYNSLYNARKNHNSEI